jgi:L-Lysine epsilon oxidase N-terminal/L-lysine epsilon oxidase C-terminal domain
MTKLDRIVRAGIHPGIGIARVGDSRDPNAFFIGPEVPHPTPAPKGGYKDSGGFLKRQAAKFRIFGYDSQNRVVEELTCDNADIKWTVHVANKKAAWYCFNVALDIPEAVPVPRRNANFAAAERKGLIIDPGRRSISGKKNQGKKYQFDSGNFLGRKVYLGELRTDDEGRLVFLGGRGVSTTPLPLNTAIDFANNDGWHDDISDGPVNATVKLSGKAIPVDPAWVVVAPPNYAPDVISIQTMYDVMVDTFQNWWLNPVEKVSFREHIYPILSQFCQAQWVNYGFYVQFGWAAPYNFLRSSYFKKLSSPKSEYSEIRRQIFNVFRNPDYKFLDVHAWPQVYGDNMNVPDTDARQLLALTKTQYRMLKRWTEGDFVADWDPKRVVYDKIDDYPLQERPAVLDKAALDFCMGGPFHPGCEMTWPMRHPSLYRAPFRIRPRASGDPEPDYGDMLTPETISASDGPLAASGPGDITRWMAIPWQTDTASCRAGYEPEYDPYLPTFWPARVPNHVLAQKEYETVMDRSLPLADRMLAFSTRSAWCRGLEGAYVDQINQMIVDFSKLGVLERKPGPGDPKFPHFMLVESPPAIGRDAPREKNNVIGHVGKRRGFRLRS